MVEYKMVDVQFLFLWFGDAYMLVRVYQNQLILFTFFYKSYNKLLLQ